IDKVGTGYTLTASASGLTGDTSSSFNVTSSGVLASIKLSPKTATINAGGTQTYTAEGFDSNGTSLGDVTGSTNFSGSGAATCSANACGSNTAGSYTITGTNSGKTDTATLTVKAGPLASIKLSPQTATINAGSTQTYTAKGFDAYENSPGK